MYDWIGKLTENERRLLQIGRWLQYIPRWLILTVCLLASWLAFWRAVHFRKNVIDNMSQLLNAPLPRVYRFCRSYMYNIFLTLYEIVFDSFELERNSPKRFEVRGEHHLQEALDLGKGVVLFTPHTGNFFFYYWYLSQKYPCLTVATAESKELRPLYLLFERLGCEGMDYDQTAPLEIIRKLRRHLKENKVVFLLGDFYRETFPKSYFFNRPTRSPNGTAALALEWGTPVVPFYGYRIRGFRHRLNFGNPLNIHEQFQADQRSEATNELNKVLEQYVRDVPDQWFYWFNVNERWGS